MIRDKIEKATCLPTHLILRPADQILSMKTRIVLLAALLLSGCAFHHAPHPIGVGDTPLAETTVFSVVDDKADKTKGAYVTSIQFVDDQQTPRSFFPVWVRLRPGHHDFVVRYATDFWVVVDAGRPGAFSGGSKQLDIPVTIPDMKPRHVYVARFQKTDETVRVEVEDLGERPKYGIYVGKAGVNREFHPVGF